jgi:hypothetical protein
MPHYRLYLLDPNDRIIRGADLEAIDDDDACLLASDGFHDRAVVEVWSGTRYIGRIVASQ